MKKDLKRMQWIRVILFILFVLALVIIGIWFKGITGKVIELISNIK